MPKYEFSITMEGEVFGENSYDAMGVIEQKIKDGAISPEDIRVKKEENEGESGLEND